MRYIELIEESTNWDLKGYWITDKQEILPVDHNKDQHHADVAFDDFIDYTGYDGPLDKQSLLGDEFIRAGIFNTVFNEGWIRVSTSENSNSLNFDLWPNKVSKRTLMTFANMIKKDKDWGEYVYISGKVFRSKRAMLYFLNRLANGKLLNSLNEVSEVPFNRNPKIGWIWDNDPITFYHGTHFSRLNDILQHGLKAPTDGPTAGWVSLALEPSTGRGYASMHGGETSFRKAGSKAQHVPMQDRRVLVLQIPKNYVLKYMAPARGNMDNERDKLTNEERYRKWIASGKTDQEYYALTEIRLPKKVPAKFIKGWMK